MLGDKYAEYKVQKRINRIIAGLVSAAMAFTMVPDVWLPVHAEIVSNQIKMQISARQQTGMSLINTAIPNMNLTATPMLLLKMRCSGMKQERYAKSLGDILRI